jgi:hypothetical protein
LLELLSNREVLVTEFSNTSFEKIATEHKLQELQNKLKTLYNNVEAAEERYKVFLNRLFKKYGPGKLNVSTLEYEKDG